MRALILAVVLLCSACVQYPAAYGSRAPKRAPVTLRIENDEAVPLRVYIDGLRVGTADAMRVSCIALPIRSSTTRIVIVPLAGEAFALPEAMLDSQPGWSLNWGHTPNLDMLSFKPAARCRPTP